MFKKILSNFTKNQLSFNRNKKIKSEEYKYFSYLFGNLNINDFVVFARENYLNKDYESHAYVDFDYCIVIDIINDEIIKKLINVNCIHLASGAGKIIFLLSKLYSFNEYIGVENMFELHELSNILMEKVLNSEYSTVVKDKNISFINAELLSADLKNKNLIIIDYNNTDNVFNTMLENKIINEAEKGCKIVKILKPFQQNIGLKLIKIKVVKNKTNRRILVYYYNKEI